MRVGYYNERALMLGEVLIVVEGDVEAKRIDNFVARVERALHRAVISVSRVEGDNRIKRPVGRGRVATDVLDDKLCGVVRLAICNV